MQKGLVGWVCAALSRCAQLVRSHVGGLRFGASSIMIMILPSRHWLADAAPMTTPSRTQTSATLQASVVCTLDTPSAKCFAY